MEELLSSVLPAEHMAWYWFTAAMVFMAIELVVLQTFVFFMGPALACAIAGVLTIFAVKVSLVDALLLTAGCWGVLYLAFRSRLRGASRSATPVNLNPVYEQLTGRQGVVAVAIADGAAGRVSVHGTSWKAIGPALDEGQRIRIVGWDADSMAVIVEPLG